MQVLFSLKYWLCAGALCTVRCASEAKEKNRVLHSCLLLNFIYCTTEPNAIHPYCFQSHILTQSGVSSALYFLASLFSFSKQHIYAEIKLDFVFPSISNCDKNRREIVKKKEKKR